MRISRGGARQHAYDLPAGLLFCLADRSRHRLVLFLGELHHQLPEAPPPPNEPPPPEKPPPKPPPPPPKPPPSPQPDPQPPGKMIGVLRLPGPGGRPPPGVGVKNPLEKTSSQNTQ